MNSCNFIFASICLIQACASTTDEENTVRGVFFNIKPTDTLQIVAPNIVSANLVEYNGTFSPDGTEFYCTVNFPSQAVISFMKMNPDSTWGRLTIASFSGEHSDVDPIFSPDGSRVFFTSNTPLTDSVKDSPHNVWYVERAGAGWSSPKFIRLTGEGDYYSSVTKNGIIYFNVWKTGDIYRAVKTDSTYVTEKISETINTDRADGDPFISPDEDYIIFRGNNREDSFGGSDLYISFKVKDQWTNPENLGEPINSSAAELCPLVTSDGKLFIFSSTRLREEYNPEPLADLESYRKKFSSFDNGVSNIYAISAGFIDSLRRKHQQSY